MSNNKTMLAQHICAHYLVLYYRHVGNKRSYPSRPETLNQCWVDVLTIDKHYVLSPIPTLEKQPPVARMYNDLVNYSLYHRYAQIIET